jgi:hypothetical protein
MIPSSLPLLAEVPPEFLNKSTGLLVISEDAELAVSQTKLALEAVAHILEDAASLEAIKRNQGHNGQFLAVPYECMAALMRVLSEPLRKAEANCTVSLLADVRPDLTRRAAR